MPHPLADAASVLNDVPYLDPGTFILGPCGGTVATGLFVVAVVVVSVNDDIDDWIFLD